MINNKMRRLENLLDDLPKSQRKLDVRFKVSDRDIKYARVYGRHYYDGNRKQGYGGYKYDGRWAPVSKKIIKELKIEDSEIICDIGCAKGFLLYELTKELSKIRCIGLDVSLYALREAIQNEQIIYINANATSLPFADNSIDHILSINSLHNFLSREETLKAISEIERVCKINSYIRVAAYRNLEQKRIIDNWATGGRCYLHVDEWIKLFKEAKYTGFYDWWHPDNTIKL